MHVTSNDFFKRNASIQYSYSRAFNSVDNVRFSFAIKFPCTLIDLSNRPFRIPNSHTSIRSMICGKNLQDPITSLDKKNYVFLTRQQSQNLVLHCGHGSSVVLIIPWHPQHTQAFEVSTIGTEVCNLFFKTALMLVD